MNNQTSSAAIAVPDSELAKLLNVSVAFLRKDRIRKRTIPFYRVGNLVRYDVDLVRRTLLARQEGGLVK